MLYLQKAECTSAFDAAALALLVLLSLPRSVPSFFPDARGATQAVPPLGNLLQQPFCSFRRQQRRIFLIHSSWCLASLTSSGNCPFTCIPPFFPGLGARARPVLFGPMCPSAVRSHSDRQ